MLVGAAFIFLLPPTASTQDADAGDDVAEMEDNGLPEDVRLRVMVNKVEPALDAAVKKLLTPERLERLARFWGAGWPIAKIDKSPERIQQDVDAQIGAAMRREYPESRIKQCEVEARAKYRLFKHGDDVGALKKKNGEIVRGIRRELDTGRVKILNEWVIIDDLVEESRAHFDKALSLTLIAKETTRLKAELRDARLKYRAGIKNQIEETVYAQAGYVRSHGSWISRASYFRDQLVAYRKRLEDILSPALEARFYHQEGYVFVGDRWVTIDIGEEKRLEDEFDHSDFQSELESLTGGRITIREQGDEPPEEEGNEEGGRGLEFNL